MKTRNDDFSGKEHPQEHNIQSEFKFTAPDGTYYKLELDFSPKSFLDVIGKHCIRKPVPWQKFTEFTEAEKAKLPAGTRRRGTYAPALNVNSVIATLVSEEISQ